MTEIDTYLYERDVEAKENDRGDRTAVNEKQAEERL